LVAWLGVAVFAVWGQTLPGATVEERAVNGAKEYIKKHNLTNPTLTMLMISLFKNSMPTYAGQWEKLTGVKMQFIEYGYTDIPAKIMAEAIAKTGQYDIFNQFPYVIPDAVGSGVLMPLDAYAEKGNRTSRASNRPYALNKITMGSSTYSYLMATI
jgi:ABC-type glycerol-3-phosphate transport system substrate-binding protein